MQMYSEFGFGLFLIELKESQIPTGLCGLIKRDSLDDVDLGFAFLPDYWGKGYAMESSLAIMSYAKSDHSLSRLVAITMKDNSASIALLNKLGFQFERTLRLQHEKEELDLYAIFL